MEDSVVVLNRIARCKIAPSQVHGVGIFAISHIQKGEKLYADMYPQVFRIPYKKFDKIEPAIRQLIIERWPRVVNNEPFMFPDIFLQGYMNHSPDPNYDATKDVSLRDIEEGEEVLEDYTKIPGYEKSYSWLRYN